MRIIKKIIFNKENLNIKLNFYSISISIFFLSLLFSNYYFQINYFYNIKVAPFDILILIYLPFLVINYKTFIIKIFLFF